jgi:hypothetical protein
MDDQNLDKIISDLQTVNVQQRRAASYKLAKFKNPKAVSALILAYDDTDSSVRQNSINGLNYIGSKEALDFLSSKGIVVSKLPKIKSYSESSIPLKKHLLFIIIGAVMGTLPGLIIAIGRVGSTGAINVSWVMEAVGISLIMGGVPGLTGGWIGGAIVKHNWGAVVGGLLGSGYWALAAATMM